MEVFSHASMKIEIISLRHGSDVINVHHLDGHRWKQPTREHFHGGSRGHVHTSMEAFSTATLPWKEAVDVWIALGVRVRAEAMQVSTTSSMETLRAPITFIGAFLVPIICMEAYHIGTHPSMEVHSSTALCESWSNFDSLRYAPFEVLS